MCSDQPSVVPSISRAINRSKAAWILSLRLRVKGANVPRPPGRMSRRGGAHSCTILQSVRPFMGRCLGEDLAGVEDLVGIEKVLDSLLQFNGDRAQFHGKELTFGQADAMFTGDGAP